jgi:dTDP-4-amino-4,6-dideoxygalactose transaminase
MDRFAIPFYRPPIVGGELDGLRQAVEARHLSADGEFTRRCQSWLDNRLGPCTALLTHSCTGALELATLLCDLRPNDEVIMPSFSFVSTASAVALRGARPVFVDIRPDTLNLDETRIAEAITERTRGILVTHYAGVACEMQSILEIARKNDLIVIEDAAHALLARYRGRALGTIGSLGALSFHSTKNIVSGEGGALLVGDPRLAARAAILRDKGTNRDAFLDGKVAAYQWVDLGSSFAPSELVASFLLPQLENADRLTDRRQKIWEIYHQAFAPLEMAEHIRRPAPPADCEHNAHIYYLVLPGRLERDAFIRHMAAAGIDCRSHYEALHLSPAGMRHGRTDGPLRVTERTVDGLVRLPLWADMLEEPARVIAAAEAYLRASAVHRHRS